MCYYLNEQWKGKQLTDKSFQALNQKDSGDATSNLESQKAHSKPPVGQGVVHTLQQDTKYTSTPILSYWFGIYFMKKAHI